MKTPILVLLILSCLITPVWAGGDEPIDNIGYMKSPPKELTDRFPMCEEFLKVDWIDKEKMIGYATYDVISTGGSGEFDGEKKRVWVLVDLNALSISSSVYEYWRKKHLAEVFEMVKKGTVVGHWPLQINYMGKTTTFYGLSLVYDNFPSLNGHKESVCLPYPDGEKTIILEGATLRNIYNDSKIEIIQEKVKKDTGIYNLRSDFADVFMAFDINNDGDKDFIIDGSVIYSRFGKYYSAKMIFEPGSSMYVFPPLNKTCTFQSSRFFSLASDGKSYFMLGDGGASICNLTELISGKEGE